MNTESKKSTQIFLGILSGIGIWLVGFLMSGRLAFVEDMELYPTGKLILGFPFVLAFLCIMIAKYSARAGKRVYYITAMISLLFPLLSMLISSVLGSISGWDIPVISDVAEFLVMFFMIPYVPAFSIFYQIIEATSTDAVAVTACVACALIGMVISVAVYKKEKNRI